MPLGGAFCVLGLVGTATQGVVGPALLGITFGGVLIGLCLWDAPPAPDEVRFRDLRPWGRVAVVLGVALYLLVGWLSFTQSR